MKEEIEKVHLWSDNGKDFHCAINLIWAKNVKERFNISMSVNFFEPGEGKSDLDRHFASRSTLVRSSLKSGHESKDMDSFIAPFVALKGTSVLKCEVDCPTGYKYNELKRHSKFLNFTFRNNEIVADQLTNLGETKIMKEGRQLTSTAKSHQKEQENDYEDSLNSSTVTPFSTSANSSTVTSSSIVQSNSSTAISPSTYLVCINCCFELLLFQCLIIICLSSFLFLNVFSI
jgi:hypothetical protein